MVRQWINLKEIADISGFEARRKASEANGKLRLVLVSTARHRGLRYCAIKSGWPIGRACGSLRCRNSARECNRFNPQCDGWCAQPWRGTAMKLHSHKWLQKCWRIDESMIEIVHGAQLENSIWHGHIWIAFNRGLWFCNGSRD